MRGSDLFCAYRSGRFQHAVLIYGYDGNNVHALDPRQSAHVTLARSWLEGRAPIAMMRR